MIKKDFAKKFTQQQNNKEESFRADFITIFDKLAYNTRRADKILKYEEFCRTDKVQDVLTKVLTMIETDNNQYEKYYKALFLNLLLFIEPQAAMNALYIDKEGKLTKFGNQFIELTKKLGCSKAFYYEENLNHNHAVNYKVIDEIKALKKIVENDKKTENIFNIIQCLVFKTTKNYERYTRAIRPLIELSNEDKYFLHRNRKKLPKYDVSFDDITDQRFELIEKHFLSREAMLEKHGFTIGEVMIPFFTSQKDLNNAKNFDLFLDMYIKKVKDMIKSEKLDLLLLENAHSLFCKILDSYYFDKDKKVINLEVLDDKVGLINAIFNNSFNKLLIDWCGTLVVNLLQIEKDQAVITNKIIAFSESACDYDIFIKESFELCHQSVELIIDYVTKLQDYNTIKDFITSIGKNQEKITQCTDYKDQTKYINELYAQITKPKIQLDNQQIPLNYIEKEKSPNK